MNLKKNVENVDSHTNLSDFFLVVSSEMCIPSASDIASAMDITIIPPITAKEDPVTEFKPTIIPNVVIIPEVNPNPNPFFIDFFILNVLLYKYPKLKQSMLPIKGL